MGGMGILCKNVCENLPINKYCINVVGTHQKKTEYAFGTYYPTNPINLMIGQTDPILYSFLNQMSYVEAVPEPPDILHCHDWSTFGAGLFLKRKYGCKLVSSIQLDISDIDSQTNILQKINIDHAKAIQLQTMQESDIIIQVSSLYATKYQLFGPKTVVINNGVNNKEFEQGQKIKLPGNEPVKVLYLGRFADMKNTLQLSLIDLPRGMDLLFCGDIKGSEPHEFMQCMKNIESNPCMHHIGPYYGQEKVNLLHSVDAVIFPSLREPFGIVGLEAMAAGTPLLASEVGGMKDYLNDINHLYCGTTKETIENCLKVFLDLTADQKNEIKRNGKQTARLFDWQDVAKKYEEVYDFLVK